jgi:chemotaxis regulatin CheY-phosphate phosphatase CheZ
LGKISGLKGQRMDKEQQAEVSVLVGNGEFTLNLPGVRLNVRLTGENGSQSPCFEIKSIFPATGLAGEGAATLFGAPAVDRDNDPGLAGKAAYYRRISQEIYEGLGRLAKEINLSIQDLSLEEIVQTNMTSPGERLEQVRNQVADVLEMTEKATLNILNLVEHIQEDCVKVQGHLAHLAEGNGGAKDPPEATGGAGGTGTAAAPWSAILAQAEALDGKIRQELSHDQSPEPALRQVALADILQLLLEFCGTEAVKPHLKSVLAQKETFFDVADAEQTLARLAAETPQEGGFYEFPVDKVLTLLQETCLDEKVKELFAKLLASAEKIFPTPTLPLESQPEDCTPAPPSQPEVGTLWQEFYETLQRIAASATEGDLCRPFASEEGLQETAQEALATVGRIHASLSRITEALAFQDLSGQRLLKILKILRQLQVQVLSLLVAAGDKLKVNPEGREVTFTPGELSAQAELNRMINTCAPSTESLCASETPVAEQPLDQDAINELLTGMGF